MSAHIEVIDQYLHDVAYSERNSDVRYAMEAVLSNYRAALNDVDRYHRWFTTTRDLLWEIAEADDRLSAGQLKDIARRWFDKGKRR